MKIPLNQFDIMTTLHGLKELEGFMGHDIRETAVSFDTNRKLTEEELEEVIKYCTHDVEETMEIFLHRKEEFDSQMALLKAFELPLKYIGKTKAQLAAVILKARKMNREDEFDLILPDTLRIKKYSYIVDWYKNPVNHNYEKALETGVSGVAHVFAWGGLHGARDKYQDEGILVSLDVSSFYPSLMLEYGFLSRNVEDPKLYQEIYNERMRLKSLKDPMQQPYKIVLNSTYGAMKHQYNNLYDPRQANNVCVGGQLLLLDLIEQLEPHWKLIQSNTDGLIGKIKFKADLTTIKTICKQWEERTRMKLDFELFHKIYQKDVNNYIIIKEDGSYKSKGAYVKKLNSIDNDLPIVNEALKKHFINKTPVEDTIYGCKDLMQFQKVVKVSHKYSHALYGEKSIPERTLRVFASRNNDPGVFKVKESGRIEKIAGTPDSCFIVNDNVIGRRISRRLDRDWYVNLAKKRLKDYIGKET
ncbi:DNA polymerase elongation subunit (family B) [Acetoanaerobium pronyense]|uniref:DNA polymerase elongation subunit (Family B) n=2 Tax=Acetoanaerobium pronyense TaxID=1482736 RepID=A0ABS4KM54_9FIRM|nr:DNA polymerase elongation subunit (family B) [Acetoanaerobium pronyense]